MGNMPLAISRAVITFLIFAYLFSLGLRNDLKNQKGWSWIIAGISLIFLGSLMDILAEMSQSQPPQIFGVGSFAFLENGVGYLPGFAFIAAGLWKWTPSIAGFQRAQAELDLIFENALVGIVLVREREIIRANRLVEEMFGWERHEFIGQSTEKFYPSREDYDRVGTEGYPLLARGETYHCEQPMKKKDGSLLFCRISGRAMDKSDRLKGSIWIIQDIDERKRAEMALRKSEEKYRNVINTTSEGFWAINENLETVEVNDSLVNMLGYSREQMMKLSILDLVDGENRNMVLELLTQIPSTTHRRYDVTLRRADGSLAPMVFNGTTMRDKDWHVTGAFSFITDISEMKRAQEELERAKDAAENASRLKDKLVSLVSHDLRSPITSILSLLELARSGQQGSVEPRQAELLSKAAETGENMLGMIDRLLDMGRLQSGILQLEKKFTGLGLIVTGAFDGMRISAAAKGVELVNLVSPETQAYVDRDMMMSVVGNLVSNAVKFSHRGGVVEVYVTGSERLVLAVRDHGVGVSRREAEDIFTAERKPARTGTAGERGAGVGLSLCAEIVQAHGGRIWAEPGPDGGSVFFVEIPRVEPAGR